MEQKDIERVKPLIRALYMHQPVMMHPDWECFNDNRPTMVEAHHFEDSQKKRWDKGYLLLRPLSSITDEELITLAKITSPIHLQITVPETASFEISRSKSAFWVYIRDELFFQPILFFFKDDNMFSFVYQWLIQHGFALPYYDSITNTTLTPEQMQEYGIIKLK